MNLCHSSPTVDAADFFRCESSLFEEFSLMKELSKDFYESGRVFDFFIIILFFFHLKGSIAHLFTCILNSEN